MIEVHGDLWEYPADIHVITTNGVVKKNGCCVMGRGCAQQARDMFPLIDLVLGNRISDQGNIVHDLGPWQYHDNHYHIMSFPVKHHWRDQADIRLIEQSAIQLARVTLGSVVIPRPGCGNGGLDWDDVRPVLKELLDDRFTVITY